MRSLLNYNKIIITIILLLPWASFSQKAPSSISPSMCENLYTAACDSEYEQDGTTKNFEIYNVRGDEEAKLHESVKLSVYKFLDRSKDLPIFSELLSNLDLKSDGECNKSKSKNCLDLVTNLIMKSFRNDVVEAILISYDNGSYTEDAFFQSVKSPLPKDKEFQGIRKSYLREIAKLYDSSSSQRDIEHRVFPRLKRLMIEKIESLNIKDSIKYDMKEKISSLKYRQGCSSSNSILSDIFYDNASYSVVDHTVSICNGVLSRAFSEYGIVSALVHEIAHSIDTCFLYAYENRNVEEEDLLLTDEDYKKYSSNREKKMLQKYPLDKLVTCLRGKHSVNATQYAVETVESLVAYCEDDQIGESISDWYASEILPVYVDKYLSNSTSENRRQGYRNVARDFCGKGDDLAFSVHPKGVNRVNGILQVNPSVRRQMGCDNLNRDYKYCSESGLIDKAKKKSKTRGVASVSILPVQGYEKFEFKLMVNHHNRISSFIIVKEKNKYLYKTNISGKLTQKEVSKNFLTRIKKEVDSYKLRNRPDSECHSGFISVEYDKTKSMQCFGQSQKLEHLANVLVNFR